MVTLEFGSKPLRLSLEIELLVLGEGFGEICEFRIIKLLKPEVFGPRLLSSADVFFLLGKKIAF